MVEQKPTKRPSFFLPIYFSLLLHLCLGSRSITSRHFVIEERPPGEYVTSLLKDFPLDFHNSNNNDNNDNDRYDNALSPISFSVVTRPVLGDDCFSIDPRSGEVHTTRTVDREEICPGSVERCAVVFYVAAQRSNAFQILKLAIEIEDVNDNPPIFQQPSYDVHVSEATEIGSGIVLPTATDADSPGNGIGRYHIDHRPTSTPVDRRNNARAKFKLTTRPSADGLLDVKLIVREKLDRESRDSYTMILVAMDLGEPSRSGTTRINVIVDDANDNTPVFDMKVYEVWVTENPLPGTYLFSVRATDDDADRNAEITYEFSPDTVHQYGDLFSLDPRTGRLSVRGVLDYESTKECTLLVTATDGGADPQTGYTSIVVHVEDLNDNAPVIVVNSFEAHGVETAKPTTWLSTRTVRPVEEVVDEEDEEEEEGHKSSTRRILVTPTHTSALIAYAEILENEPIGSVVAHVSVTDADSGKNGRITCILQEGSSEFSLTTLFQYDYKLTSIVNFDREEQDQYLVSVICLDHGERPLSSTVSVVVEISDINDHDPYFIMTSLDEPLMLFVRENSPVNTIIGHLNASDRDRRENSRLEYEISEWKSYGSLFGSFVGRINEALPLIAVSDNGDVIIRSDNFDYERVRSYTFEVTALDDGLPPSGRRRSVPIKVRLNILDTDDETPKFANARYAFGVLENQPRGTLVGSVTAIDQDSPPHNRFYYQMAPGVDAEAFVVDKETGAITTQQEFDREAEALYNITIFATPLLVPNPYIWNTIYNVTFNQSQLNNLNSNDHQIAVNSLSSTIVEISIIDLNDNSPEFIEITLNSGDSIVHVSRHSNIGCVVARLLASDNDTGQNAVISYSIANVTLAESKTRKMNADDLGYSILGNPKDSSSQNSGTRNDTHVSYDLNNSNDPARSDELLKTVLETISIDSESGELVITSPLTDLASSISMVQLTCLASDNGRPRRLSSAAVLTLTFDWHAPLCLRHTVNGQIAAPTNDVIVWVVIITSLVLVTLVMLATGLLSIYQQNRCSSKKTEVTAPAEI